MKKCLGVILLVFSSALIFAQTTTITNPVKDTVKTNLGKIKIADGTGMTSANNIIENIDQSQNCTTLATVIKDAGLTETFESKGPITVFAPTNKAFEKLPAGELDSLLKPGHKLDLNYLLTYHAIAGKLTVKDIARKINAGNGQAVFTTIAGSRITAKIDGNRNIVLIDENGGESIISKFDIQQSNGIVHLITAVLVPKPKSI